MQPLPMISSHLCTSHIFHSKVKSMPARVDPAKFAWASLLSGLSNAPVMFSNTQCLFFHDLADLSKSGAAATQPVKGMQVSRCEDARIGRSHGLI